MKITVGDVVTVTVPEEPADGSAVLASDGRVFQRWGGDWHAVDLAHRDMEWCEKHMNWATLLVVRGPVIVLYVT